MDNKDIETRQYLEPGVDYFCMYRDDFIDATEKLPEAKCFGLSDSVIGVTINNEIIVTEYDHDNEIWNYQGIPVDILYWRPNIEIEVE